MQENEAEKNLIKRLNRADSPIYVFQPVDVEERFSLGVVAVAVAAGFLISAFLKGVKAALEERVESYGKSIANWLIKKVEGLFRKPEETPEIDEDNQQKEVETLRVTLTKIDIRSRDLAFESSEELIKKILMDKGELQTRAAEIAKLVRQAAEIRVLG